MSAKRFIACGMYAFNDDLRHAWQALFDRVIDRMPDPGPVEPGLVFETGREILCQPDLLLGHTCGYPLVNQLRDHVHPICVPVFDIPGTDGVRYSSHFIVPADSDLQTLSDCRGLIAAINTTDSNSGMNLLRHAIAGLSRGAPYFARVDVTGAHRRSLEAVAANRAQLAAIDCVSFHYLADQNPQLVARVRSIGFSAQTTGLPFVRPGNRHDEDQAKAWTDAFNAALNAMPEQPRQRLRLLRFEPVTVADYQEISELETIAIEKGYAELK